MAESDYWLEHFFATKVMGYEDTYGSDDNVDTAEGDFERHYPYLASATRRTEEATAWALDNILFITNVASDWALNFSDMSGNSADYNTETIPPPDWVIQARESPVYNTLDIASLAIPSPESLTKGASKSFKLGEKILSKVAPKTDKTIKAGEIAKKGDKMANMRRVGEIAAKLGKGVGKQSLNLAASAIGGAASALGVGSVSQAVQTGMKLSETETFPVHAGSSNGGISKLFSNGYDFTAILCSPTKRDIQALDDFFSAYGYAVNKWGTPKIDFSQNKGNNSCFYLKVGDSCSVSPIREAQLQLDTMCMKGVRFWKKEIGQS